MPIRYLSGVNVDSNTLVVDAANDRVGIGTASPNTALHVIGLTQIVESGNIAFYGGNFVRVFNDQNFNIRDVSGNTVANISVNGASYFNGGNVGIGTTGPNARLTVVANDSSNPNVALRLSSTAYSGNPYPNTSLRFGADYPNYSTWNLASIDSSYTGSSWGGSLLFYTNNDSGTGNLTERMRITSDGNVGIGTSSPTYKLDVAGTISNNSAQNIIYASYDAVAALFQRVGTYGGVIQLGRSGVSNSTTIDYPADGTFAVSTASSERMRITSAGNVGIGTTSPSRLFDVSAVNPQMTLKSTTTTGFSEYYFSDSAGDPGYLSYAHNGDYLAIGVNSSERMRITSAGNVGIGTTGPTEKLHVAGRIMAAGSGYTLNPTAPIFGQYSSTRGYVQVPTNGQFEIWNGGTATIATFHENYNSIFYGNVGIGTTSPASKLQIGSVGSTGYGVGNGLAFGDGTRAGALNVDASGTTLYSSTNLIFSPGTTEAVRITTTGSVGIGTASPAFPLTVYHATNSAATFQTSGTGTGAGNGFYVGHASNISYVWNYNNFPLVLATNNTERVRVTEGGNVGIGTTAPDSLLHISGSGNTFTRYTNTTSAGHYIDIGANSAGQSFVYGYGAYPLLFATNGSEAMRITSAGNIGIGTTAPSNPLHVEKDAGGSAIAYFNSLNADGYGVAIRTADTGNDKYVLRLDSNSGSTPVMYATNSGNVGIGTTSPANTLDIAAAQATLKLQSTTGTNTVFARLENTAGTFYIGRDNSAGSSFGFANAAILYESGANPMVFVTNSAEHMRITSAGNVGIGTTSPAYKLHVQGSNLMATFRNSSTGADQYTQLEFIAGSRDAYIWLGNQNTTAWAGDGGLNIYTGTGNMDFWTAATQKMRLTASGNLGIGTTSPNAKLEVNGAIRTSFLASGNAFLEIYSGSIAGYIEQKNANPLITIVNGSERMRITDAGNIGIGNTSPSGRVNISNATGANAPTTVTAANSYLHLGNSDYGPSSNGKFMIALGYVGGSPNTNAPAYIGFEETNTGGATKGALTFYTRDVITDTAPTERLYIAPNGNVGIGTTGPVSIGTGITTLDIQGSNAGGVAFGPSGTKNYIYGASTMYVEAHTTAVFTTSGSERMRITSAGDVGIGTASPISKLTVLAASTGYSSDSQIKISDGSTSYYGGLSFDDSGATRLSIRNSYDGVGSVIGFGFGSSADKVQIIDGTGLIVNEGNVGINTTAPKTKLDINGTIGFGSKTLNISDTFATVLTVNMSNHTGCYVKITAFGDWPTHSAVAYLGEFFLQNGASAYNEPGTIIRQVDNTNTDDVVAQIVDPAGTGTRDFEIQLKTTSASGVPFSAAIQYEVRGQYNSVS